MSVETRLRQAVEQMVDAAPRGPILDVQQVMRRGRRRRMLQRVTVALGGLAVVLAGLVVGVTLTSGQTSSIDVAGSPTDADPLGAYPVVTNADGLPVLASIPADHGASGLLPAADPSTATITADQAEQIAAEVNDDLAAVEDQRIFLADYETLIQEPSPQPTPVSERRLVWAVLVATPMEIHRVEPPGEAITVTGIRIVIIDATSGETIKVVN